MGEGHERFEAMALSHVLGGLAGPDAADLRDHLRGCTACRARVAELRALSSDLDAAERDERRRRAAARRRPTATPGGAGVGGELADPADRRAGWRPGRLVIAGLALASLPLAFWNLHLRSASGAYFATAEERATTIEALATGRLVEVSGPSGERGRVAVDQARVAIVLVGLGPLGPDERVVAWLGAPGPDGAVVWEAEVLAVGPEAEVDVSRLLARGAAERLVVGRERGLLGPGPEGPRISEVALDPATPTGP